MLKVGLTGGIGSGKSTVAKIFKVLGVPVYDADFRAKFLMQHNEELKASIIKALGPGTYLPDGSPNRKALADLVFSNKEALALLNGLVHPVVRSDFNQWSDDFRHLPYVINEAALLVESGAVSFLDQLIVINSDQSIRIKRVMQRDNTDEKAVLARIRNQTTPAKLLQASDFVISNNPGDLLIPQVINIHTKLLDPELIPT